MSKHGFLSTVRPTVHTRPGRKLGLSSTLFRLEEFEMTHLLCVSVFTENISKTDSKVCENNDVLNIRVFSNFST